MRAGAGLVALCWLHLVSAATGLAQGAEQPRKQNMLWRVESEQNVVYILGSVHLLPKSVYPLDPAIDSVFNAADNLVFELNLDSAASMESASAMMARGMYPSGRTLQSSISKETYGKVEARLKTLGLPMAMFNKFEPWVVAMMITAFDMKADGYQEDLGLDQYLHARGKEAGKKVIGLETMDAQVDLFDRMPEDAQEEFLKQTLELGPDASTGMLDRMVEAWQKGDAAGLEAIASEFVVADSSFYESILFARNRNWMPSIERYLQPGPKHLVVVGALHLVGQKGVIAMLREKGYRVEQM